MTQQPARSLIAACVLAVAALAGCSSNSGHGPPASSAGSDTVSATTHDVSFVVAGTTTYGTLEIPAHQSGQRLAGALLIPGSGPTDRDGNQPPNVTPDTLKLIAGILAKKDIATFRFDKYFTGRTGAGRYASNPAGATIAGDLGQADAAYTFLSKEKQIDPAKLLVVGHSEGGMIAMQIADTARTKPAGLALLEPQDERILDLTHVQWAENLDALVAQGTLTAAQASDNDALITQAIGQFRAGQSVNTAGMATPVAQMISPFLVMNTQPAYLRTWDLIRPVALAAKINRGTRVLVTDGTRDINVPPTTIQPLVRALTSADVTGPGLRTVQGTDHDMHLASQPDNNAVLAPDITTAIQQWATPYAH
jgi:hypothetical protein